MKGLTIIFIFIIITCVFCQNLLPQQCSTFKNCNNCASQESCVWCKGSDKCLDGKNLGDSANECYNSGGNNLVLTRIGC
jgi:hypothetical protein